MSGVFFDLNNTIVKFHEHKSPKQLESFPVNDFYIITHHSTDFHFSISLLSVEITDTREITKPFKHTKRINSMVVI